MKATVIVPTHNPNAGRFAATLEGLELQTLPRSEWELVIVDNASEDQSSFENEPWNWHPNARCVREDRLGLTWARLCGFGEAKAPVIVLADDDNVLAPDYLEQALRLMEERLELGVVGGKSLPSFEVKPPDWVRTFDKSLALRDYGDEAIVSNWGNGQRAYPSTAPIGAGMVLRSEVARIYRETLEMRTGAFVSDRSGKSLASGGDNDIVLCALGAGWSVGYFPELVLTHIIPEGRCTREYLSRLHRASNRSWIQILDLHGLRPRRPVSPVLAPLAMARAFWQTRPWSGPVGWVRWQNRRGEIEGRTKLK